MISLSSNIRHIDILRSQVCRVPKVTNNNGKIQIMRKIDMKQKLKIPSPNMFDCMMMSLDIPDTIGSRIPTRMPQPIKRLPRR